MASRRYRRTAFFARSPRTIAQALGIDVCGGGANDGVGIEVGHNSRYRRIDDEWYEE